MLIGTLLVLTWLVLLVRYPVRAVPVSLGALAGLALVALWMAWQDHRLQRQLEQLEVELLYRPDYCPPGTPLQASVHNTTDHALAALHWQIAAYAAGDSTNLAQPGRDRPRYEQAVPLAPGERWTRCIALPDLRTGYRPGTLRFQAERLEGQFD